MKNKKIKVAIVGLRFGGEFPQIYRDHPDVLDVVICDQDEQLLNDFGDKFNFADRYVNFNNLLDSDVDAIHIVTNIHTHHDLTVKTLKAGKHCACTVPMATTLSELQDIVNAQRSSGKNYMMMETAVYTYQCLYVKELIKQGRIGNIQFMRGIHFQDMEGWPQYWMGLPPMHYSTHAVSPLMFLSGLKMKSVRCLGSGIMRDDLKSQYGNPFPVESALFQMKDQCLAAEVTRSLFQTAREYVEGFTILAEQMSFEWNYEDEDPYIFEFIDQMALTSLGSRGRGIKTKTVKCPDYKDRLPKTIQKYTKEHTILDPENPHLSIKQGGGHHGSHPHLVHEFVRSIIELRSPLINAETAAHWTAAGICAHESAINEGIEIEIPQFELHNLGATDKA